ncbi:hypothetical protein SAY86_029936 [Trapa natans]|uniref:Uncharacterized protein n=1 Tax=Trapa natans TaxID=22666 RepID=A0AAN7M232_TRANT|nr:hypothetical protein SAY86_029936 [Trapa natans]
MGASKLKMIVGGLVCLLGGSSSHFLVWVVCTIRRNPTETIALRLGEFGPAAYAFAAEATVGLYLGEFRPTAYAFTAEAIGLYLGEFRPATSEPAAMAGLA